MLARHPRTLPAEETRHAAPACTGNFTRVKRRETSFQSRMPQILLMYPPQRFWKAR